MTEIDRLVRENISALTPYSCARDEFSGSDGTFLDANENPFGSLNRYPDPYQRELKEKISVIKGIPASSIFLGNGSDEIIDLCFRIFCKPGSDKAIIFPPTYGMYQVAAEINDVKLVRVPLTDDFQIDTPEAMEALNDRSLKLAIICSPNNPTGNAMKASDIEIIIRNFKGIVLIDEAYCDFSEHKSFKEMTETTGNLIVMQTFSKAFGLASVRVGMAFTNPEIVHYFNKMKPPYNISALNQKAVLKKLKKNEVNTEVTKIIRERSRLSQEIAKLSCVVEVYPSDANFILVRMKYAGWIYEYLVNKEIIVRNRSSVINNCLRITIGTKVENNILLNALKSLEK